MKLDLDRKVFIVDEDGKKLPAILLTKNYRNHNWRNDQLLFQIGHAGDHHILITDANGYPYEESKHRQIVNVPKTVTVTTRVYEDKETGTVHFDVNNNYRLKEAVLPLRLIGKFKNEVEI